MYVRYEVGLSYTLYYTEEVYGLFIFFVVICKERKKFFTRIVHVRAAVGEECVRDSRVLALHSV